MVLPISTDHAEQFAWGRERFMEEARTLARLDCTPAIVRAFDFREDNAYLRSPHELASLHVGQLGR